MSTPTQIIDGKGDKHRACVTAAGQLITAPFSYDMSVFNLINSTGTAFNFFKPKAGQQVVITGIRMKADRNVSNTVDATIIIYEASAEDTATVDNIIHEENMIRGENATLLPLNILVTEGKFVNAKTDDANIPMTIFGYYIPKVT